jgi:hypothetical protein
MAKGNYIIYNSVNQGRTGRFSADCYPAITRGRADNTSSGTIIDTMQTDHLLTVAMFASLVWAAGAAVALCSGGKANAGQRLICFVASLLALIASVWMNWVESPGRNHVIFMLDLIRGADAYHLCAAGLGSCIGFGPAVWFWRSANPLHPDSTRAALGKAATLIAALGIFFFLGVLALNEHLKPYLTHRGLKSVLTDPSPVSCPPEFTLEEYHRCERKPIQLTVQADGTVFYCYQSKNGGVARLDYDPSTGAVSEREIVRNLDRPNGIALHKGELYISRSGRFTRARDGRLEEVATGAVTLVKDLDGDGVMDFFHDVVTDLPGAQGPDPLHQNNGIAFDGDGNLYVTVGAHSNRAPTMGKYEGTIVRAPHDGSQPSVYATGLRNPFDLAFGPDGELFCTDNDIGFGNAEELNHVVEGGHYGHPYLFGSEPHPPEFTPPIWLYRTSTLQGMAYANSEKLPDRFRNCLYVVSGGSGEIHQVRLYRDGETSRPSRGSRMPWTFSPQTAGTSSFPVMEEALSIGCDWWGEVDDAGSLQVVGGGVTCWSRMDHGVVGVLSVRERRCPDWRQTISRPLCGLPRSTSGR